MYSINCKGKLINFDTPKIMGILNVTPDSFYDGGTLKNDDNIIQRVENMLSEGANFIDIGGYSSRPNASDISEKEELRRVIAVIEKLVNKFPEILISIDTFRSQVAKESVEAGACMINDISAGNLDSEMFNTVAKLQVPYIMMHMPGNPQTMQQKTTYDNIITDLVFFFSQKLKALTSLKVNDVLLDVGFGFGKTTDQNYELLAQLSMFKNLDIPIVTGVSRKSMLYSVIEANAEQALNASTVAHTIALLNGTNILRVHDVKEALEAVKIVGELKTH